MGIDDKLAIFRAKPATPRPFSCGSRRRLKFADDLPIFRMSRLRPFRRNGQGAGKLGKLRTRTSCVAPLLSSEVRWNESI
jgi:hypothetical protein